MKKIMFGGSRHLSHDFSPLIIAVVSFFIKRAFSVSVACARGADLMALRSACDATLARKFSFSNISLFCVGGQDGAGFWTGSAPPDALAGMEKFGVNVSWLAGGPLTIPLKARLIKRSLAALAGCHGAIFFVSSPHSNGSMAVARKAVDEGQRVAVFCCGFEGPPSDLNASGKWLPGYLPGIKFDDVQLFEWTPAQIKLI